MDQFMQISNADCRELAEDEYEKDGEYYCKNCDTRRTVRVEVFGKVRIQNCVCRCQKEEDEKREEEARKRERQIRLNKIIKQSMLGDRYKDVSFEATETGFNPIFDNTLTRCKRYCEISSEALEKGYGMYIFGNSGSGKTHLTACMANKLMREYREVLFTNFFEISSAIRNGFKNNGSNEQNILDRIANVDFLFLDDLGTERVKKDNEDMWLQEKIFEVINKRYNNKKPTIFTSNYSLQELVEDRGLMQKTVDRIIELSTAIIKLEGESYRFKIRNNNKAPF
jgi:DNA replication protein DnaC